MPAMSFFKLTDIQELLNNYEKQGYKAFDAVAYTAKYLTGQPNEPAFSTALEHFVFVGAAAGYNPLGDFPVKIFDAKFYAEQYPELAKAGLIEEIDLIGHALRFGISEGRLLSPDFKNFDAELYLKRYPAVETYVKDHLSDFSGSLSNGALAHAEKFGVFQGFKIPIQDPETDDQYTLDHLLRVKDILELLDNTTDDTDTVVANSTAINFNGSGINTISLEVINDTLKMDFDILDISSIKVGNLVIKADSSMVRDTSVTFLSGEADKLILGNLGLISRIEGQFEALMLTDASIASHGNVYQLDTAKQGALLKGDGTPIFPINLLTGGLDASLVSQGVNLTSLTSVNQTTSTLLTGSSYNDTLVGGKGINILQGGAGRDVVNGNSEVLDVFVFLPEDSSLEQASADVVNGFLKDKSNLLFINLDGTPFVANTTEKNYVEAAQSDVPSLGAKVENFTEALKAANTALAALNADPDASEGSLISFQYDAINGYVFQDVDGNGTADQVVILTGIDSSKIDIMNFGFPSI
ncbi:MAG: hypothetical protein K1X48_05950 [Burkholderiaceae bacterium]|nr:hypothetical protein [Burkholderiaceae bacterium]